MPDFNFDAFNHDEAAGEHDDVTVENEVRAQEPVTVQQAEEIIPVEVTVAKVTDNTTANEEVDKW